MVHRGVWWQNEPEDYEKIKAEFCVAPGEPSARWRTGVQVVTLLTLSKLLPPPKNIELIYI